MLWGAARARMGSGVVVRRTRLALLLAGAAVLGDAAGNIGPVQVRVGTAGYNPFGSVPSGSALTGLVTAFAAQSRGLIAGLLAALLLIAAVRVAGPGLARMRIPTG